MNIKTDLNTHIREMHAIFARLAPKSSGLFKAVITIDFAGEDRPLLLVGNAHASCDDGHCIVVLNPTRGLVQEIMPGVAYPSPVLKKIVSGRCEQMVHFWFDHYKSPDSQISVLSYYKSNKSNPVEISAQDFRT